MKQLLESIKDLFSPYPQIRGACKKRGLCCKKLMLVDRGKPITTEKEFAKMRRVEPLYEMFERVLEEHDDGILRFSCTKLSANNLCTIHDRRPKICKNYPTLSMFKRGATLLNGCGYRLVTKESFEAILEQKMKK